MNIEDPEKKHDGKHSWNIKCLKADQTEGVLEVQLRRWQEDPKLILFHGYHQITPMPAIINPGNNLKTGIRNSTTKGKKEATSKKVGQVKTWCVSKTDHGLL